MFSTLGGIFKGQPPRQAEQTDTRQAIQRHDPDQQRRKSKSRDEEEQKAAEEGAIVTVSALQDFLVKLLTSRSPSPNPVEAQSPSVQAIDNADINSQTARSAQNSMAASAYQQTARSVQQKQVLLETTDNGAGGPEFDLSAVDTRTIQALLADLKILNEAGIEYLHIERAETFLQSLVNAAEAAKSTLT